MPVSQPPFNPTNSVVGLFNNDPRYLQKFRTAREKVYANTADCKVLEIGDSTTDGSTGATSLARIVPTRIGKLLEATGLPVSYDNILGSHWAGTTGSIAAAVPGTWTQNGGVYLAGALITGATGSWVITPAAQVTHFDIYYLTSPGSGNFSWAIDAGAATNISTNAANACQKATVSAGALGAHTLTIAAVASGIYICGVVGRNNGAKTVQVFNAGIANMGVARFSGNVSPWDGIGSIQQFAPDLLSVNLTINDAEAPTADATYEANLTAIVTAGQLSGDVILRVANPIVTSLATQAAQDAKRASVKKVALAKNCVVVDLPARWGAYGTFTSYMSGDGVHPVDAGYGDIAQAVMRALAY